MEKHQIQPERPSLDNRIFFPAIVITLVSASLLIFFPEKAESTANSMAHFIKYNLAWLYLSFGIGALAFCGWLIFGPYAHVKLGAPDEKPEYSTGHWVSMMFTAGIGAGFFVWGLAEPIYYLKTPPFGASPDSLEAIAWAHAYPMFHWGITPWAIYALAAVPIAYQLYVKKTKYLRISSVCIDGLIKTKNNYLQVTTDILIIIGIVGGTSTALGLGAPLVSSFVSALLGIPDTLYVKFAVLVVWSVLFAASVYRGLNKGIKVLADFNMILMIIAVIFMVAVGPTLFIFDITVSSVGHMFNNFLSMSLATDSAGKSGFHQEWTVFYWAWWVAYAAFVGLFIGRISRGRTIRELVSGVIIWGSLGTWMFMSVGGAYALDLQLSQKLPMIELLSTKGHFYMVTEAVKTLPLTKLALAVFIILSVIFYATSIDSAAFVLSSICSKNLRNDQEPQCFNRMIWAALLALVTAGLVISGSIHVVQSITIVSSLPLVPVVALMCISLHRCLKRDFGTTKVVPNQVKRATADSNA